MSAIENLTTNVSKLNTDVDALAAAVAAIPNQDTAIQAAADAVAAVDAKVVAATPVAPAPAQ